MNPSIGVRRINFGGNNDFFLNDGRLIQRVVDCRLPLRRRCFPAQHHAFAAVSVVGLDHEPFAVLLHPREQIYSTIIIVSLSRGNDAGPGDVSADRLDFFGREEVVVGFVAQEREAAFLVQQESLE